MIAQNWCIHERFSTAQALREAVMSTLYILNSHVRLDEETWYNLKLILNELCFNALEHGARPVYIDGALCRNSGCLHILISDSGAGFDPCSQPEPTDTFQERGRGLWIVRQLTDAMAHNTAANKTLVRIALPTL